MPMPSGRPPDEPAPAVVHTLRRAYSDAVLSGNEEAAQLAVRAAMRLGLSAGQIDVEVITPALWLVGELWERGEISIADEHLATEISLRVLVLQHELARAEQKRPGRRILLAALEGERHVVGLRMAADLLGAAGFDARYLGGGRPARRTAPRHGAPRAGCRLPDHDDAGRRARGSGVAVDELAGTSDPRRRQRPRRGLPGAPAGRDLPRGVRRGPGGRRARRPGALELTAAKGWAARPHSEVDRPTGL